MPGKSGRPPKKPIIESLDDVTVNNGGMIVEEKQDFSELPEQSQQTPPNLTPEEAAIYQRVMNEKDEFPPINESDMFDFSLSVDPFKKPKAAEDLQNRKQFYFRWAEKKPTRIDELRSADPPYKYLIVNRGSSIGHLFNRHDFDAIHGGIEKLDQILMYQPWSYKAQRDAIRAMKSKQQLDGGTLESLHGKEVDDTGSAFHAGKSARISASRDVVMSSDVLERTYAEEALQESSDDLDDIIE